MLKAAHKQQREKQMKSYSSYGWGNSEKKYNKHTVCSLIVSDYLLENFFLSLKHSRSVL